ncbi:hypothetical protein MPSEU_000307100 [Mayamaea pseudoterrestris]|nr:hypothetical protein MPSEU_000307100 [Mayamaea pseudoterrestris]
MPPAATTDTTHTTPLLNVDEEIAIASHIAATPEEVAGNWHYLFLTGLIDTVVGVACLVAPLLATQVVSLVLVVLVFCTGLFNVSTVCVTERGYQHQFFWVGVVEIFVAMILYFHRLGTMTLLTILIAVSFMIFGSLEMTVAQQDERMAARGLTFFSGILTLILSILIIVVMPITQWDTVGVLLGANLINIGICRVIVALYGRSIFSKLCLLNNMMKLKHVSISCYFVVMNETLCHARHCHHASSSAFLHSTFRRINHQPAMPPETQLSAKASSSKKRSGSSAALKGFGSSLKNTIPTDKSPTTRAFLKYLDDKGAGDNLKRTALGFVPMKDVSLRGIIAMKDLKQGQDIIDIPYELAINLGPQGDDPTIPAVQLLRDYCECHHNENERLAYYKMLPAFNGTDSLGSTDVYSNAALEALQFPLIVEETLQRRRLTQLRFEKDISSDASFPKWIDGETCVSLQHFTWAVWIVTSRVLTVQDDDSSSVRLLIPYLDMCNHDRSSVHVLTGRACSGGRLRVVAGSMIKAGTPVNICYGAETNDRFIQDYGFLDTTTPQGFRLLAQQLVGKMRMRELGRLVTISDVDRDRTLERLRETTMAEDEALLQRQDLDAQMRLTIEFRWRLKQALSEFTNIV